MTVHAAFRSCPFGLVLEAVLREFPRSPSNAKSSFLPLEESSSAILLLLLQSANLVNLRYKMSFYANFNRNVIV